MDPFNAKLAAASSGSMLTALTMTPFDVIKTRLQTQPSQSRPLFVRPPPNTCCQPSHMPCVRNMSSLATSTVFRSENVCVWDHGVMRQERVNGFYDAVKHVVRAEGIRGLWKGAGTSIMIGVPSSTLYMLTYDHLLHTTFHSIVSPALAPLIAGVSARTLITTIGSPLELIRTNLQSTPLSPDKPHTLRSVLSSVGTLARNKGPLYLWRGLGPTLWRDVPFSGLYWANYEALKGVFRRAGQEGAWVAFVSGATSGTVAALITSPFDVLKTRRQALVMSASSRTTALFPLLRQVIQNEGISALYAGIGPRMAKIAPACGIMIACYEGVGRYLTKPSP